MDRDMRTIFNYSNYGNDLRLTKSDALMCSHSGDCESDVRLVMSKKYVKRQLALIDFDNLRKELRDYGAWSDGELMDNEMNLVRWVWVSAGNIVDSTAE